VGGFAIILFSLLYLVYDLFSKASLAPKGAKMISLIMVISGFLLIIGGIIYLLYKKPIEQRPIQPISETAIPAPLQQELPKPPAESISHPSTESLSPEDINEAIANAPVLQQPEIAKHYIGIKVSWKLQLASITKQEDDNIKIMLSYPRWSREIIFEVNLNKYPGLGLLKQGAPIKIEGIIDNIDGLFIRLKDVTIISY
jgi:hypothetical protein